VNTIDRILARFRLAGEIGLTDQQLASCLDDVLPATLRGSRKRLERAGKIRKIAEEPNLRGYACGVYAMVPGEMLVPNPICNQGATNGL
jgi:hypothetical protein